MFLMRRRDFELNTTFLMMATEEYIMTEEEEADFEKFTANQEVISSEHIDEHCGVSTSCGIFNCSSNKCPNNNGKGSSGMTRAEARNAGRYDLILAARGGRGSRGGRGGRGGRGYRGGFSKDQVEIIKLKAELKISEAELKISEAETRTKLAEAKVHSRVELDAAILKKDQEIAELRVQAEELRVQAEADRDASSKFQQKIAELQEEKAHLMSIILTIKERLENATITEEQRNTICNGVNFEKLTISGGGDY